VSRQINVTFHKWMVWPPCGLKAQKFGSRYSPRNRFDTAKMLAARTPTWMKEETLPGLP
jgi:hypothetical protein